jgi:hypothetical protein
MNGKGAKDGMYRTPFLHSAFSHNKVALKEKGLLLLSKPLKKVGHEPHMGG